MNIFQELRRKELKIILKNLSEESKTNKTIIKNLFVEQKNNKTFISKTEKEERIKNIKEISIKNELLKNFRRKLYLKKKISYHLYNLNETNNKNGNHKFKFISAEQIEFKKEYDTKDYILTFFNNEFIILKPLSITENGYKIMFNTINTPDISYFKNIEFENVLMTGKKQKLEKELKNVIEQLNISNEFKTFEITNKEYLKLSYEITILELQIEKEILKLEKELELKIFYMKKDFEIDNKNLIKEINRLKDLNFENLTNLNNKKIELKKCFI